MRDENRKLTMERVVKKFGQWRGSKKKGDRIPEELWEAAVGVTAEHGINQVSRRLSLSYPTLRDRVKADGRVKGRKQQRPEFVEVALGQSGEERSCVVEVEDPRGMRMRVEFQGEAAVDVVRWSEAFWRQGS